MFARFARAQDAASRVVVVAILGGVLLITYFPPLTTALPHWLK